jgi:hypothetical protein
VAHVEDRVVAALRVGHRTEDLIHKAAASATF